MKFNIDWAENKSNDWKIVSIVGETGVKTADVSVNRVNKKGEVFPGFDDIKPGAVIEGELWTSQTGKNYLFAPKPQNAPKNNAGVAKAMERKEKSIEKFQDSKENSIKLAGAMRDAVQLAMCELEGQDKAPLASRILSWRNWIIANWGDETDVKAPF